MFDPTVFDNLKVVFEGAMYDLDFNGSVQITGRTDRLDLCAMSRCFGMEAVRKQAGVVKGRLMLYAALADLAAELLSEAGKQPGCSLLLTFIFPISDVERDCALAETIMKGIWGDGVSLTQSVRVEYGQPGQMENRLKVQFVRKLDEKQIDDIPSLLDHFLMSMEKLDQQFSGA